MFSELSYDEGVVGSDPTCGTDPRSSDSSEFIETRSVSSISSKTGDNSKPLVLLMHLPMFTGVVCPIVLCPLLPLKLDLKESGGDPDDSVYGGGRQMFENDKNNA